jgi:phosphinothricin acetyltransferase
LSSHSWQVRPAEPKDLQSINDIYNEAVLHTTATFDTEPKQLSERMEWYKKHGGSHPLLVAEGQGTEQGKILAWAALTVWSDKQAYARTAELSIYVHHEARSRGVASDLLPRLLAAGHQAQIRCVIARITEGNEISLKLHAQNGFEEVGILRQVGEKFGKVLNVHLLQKLI